MLGALTFGQSRDMCWRIMAVATKGNSKANQDKQTNVEKTNKIRVKFAGSLL